MTTQMHVIPSEVENGAAGEAATWTEGRRLSERQVGESNPLANRGVISRDPSTPLRFAQDDSRDWRFRD